MDNKKEMERAELHRAIWQKTRENIQSAIRVQYMTSGKKKDILKIYFQYFVG